MKRGFKFADTFIPPPPQSVVQLVKHVVSVTKCVDKRVVLTKCDIDGRCRADHFVVLIIWWYR